MPGSVKAAFRKNSKVEKVRIGIIMKDGRKKEEDGGGRSETRRRKHGGGIRSKRREKNKRRREEIGSEMDGERKSFVPFWNIFNVNLKKYTELLTKNVYFIILNILI